MMSVDFLTFTSWILRVGMLSIAAIAILAIAFPLLSYVFDKLTKYDTSEQLEKANIAVALVTVAERLIVGIMLTAVIIASIL